MLSTQRYLNIIRQRLISWRRCAYVWLYDIADTRRWDYVEIEDDENYVVLTFGFVTSEAQDDKNDEENEDDAAADTADDDDRFLREIVRRRLNWN